MQVLHFQQSDSVQENKGQGDGGQESDDEDINRDIAGFQGAIVRQFGHSLFTSEEPCHEKGDKKPAYRQQNIRRCIIKQFKSIQAEKRNPLHEAIPRQGAHHPEQ